MSENKVSPLNCVEIEEILKELNLKGSFIRDIIQPDYKRLVLELYQSGCGEIRLMLDLRAQKSSLYPLNKEDKIKNQNLRFMQIMRAQCRGGRIISVYQHDFQRIVVFHVKHGAEEKYLYVRLWGARSNIFLCDAEGNIADVFFRRPESREISGGIFTLPAAESPSKSYNLRVLEGNKTFARLVREYFFENINDTGLREEFLALYRRESAHLELQIQKLWDQRKNNEILISRYREQADALMGRLHQDSDGNLLKEAQNYYEKKKSLERKNIFLAEQTDSLKAKRRELDRQYELRDDEDFLNSSVWKKPLQNEKNPVGALSFVRSGITLLVGRSAQENDFLLRHVVKPHEWWLHVRDYGGCYVFVRTKKNQILPDNVRLDACALAVHYSKAKNASYADIHCTQVKYLRRIKGQIGKVSLMREKSIVYRTDEKRLAEILSRS